MSTLTIQCAKVIYRNAPISRCASRDKSGWGCRPKHDIYMLCNTVRSVLKIAMFIDNNNLTHIVHMFAPTPCFTWSQSSDIELVIITQGRREQNYC